jgi:hypothetical protein
MSGYGLRRRRFLRRAAIAGGGVAAVSTVAAAFATPAQAGPGDPVRLGQSNDAGATTTSVTTSPLVPGATLRLDNQGDRIALRLTPVTGEPVFDPGSGAGQLAVDSVGDLHLLDPGGPVKVYSTRWATRTMPLPPSRPLDTRYPGGRVRIISGLSNLDSAGRIRAGETIVFQIDEFAPVVHAIRANVTVVNTTSGGYVTVWGRGPRPATSSINWWAPGQVLSNTVLTQLGDIAIDGALRGAVAAIYASAPAAVVVDLVAVIHERAIAPIGPVIP